LYVRAGILDAERDRDEIETRAVILADPTLSERQKQVLLQIYESFRKENGFEIAPPDAVPAAQGDGAALRGSDVQDSDVLDDDTAVEDPRKTDGSDADPHRTAS
jgi:hypothetical protein